MSEGNVVRHGIKLPQARWAALSGLAGVAFAIGLTVVGGALWPGYSHLNQFISELGASDAPHGWQISFLGFLPAGILLTLFTIFAWMALPKNTLVTLGLISLALYALGYTMSAFFPCEAGCRPDTLSLSQTLHNSFGLIGYIIAPPALALLAVASRKWQRAASMPLVGWTSATASLSGLLTLLPDSPFVGLSQRILEGGVLLWIASCALYLGRAEK